MPLVSPEYQHVAFIEQVVFTARDQFNLTAFAGQVLSCTSRMRYAHHASARCELGSRYLKAGQGRRHQRPECCVLAPPLPHVRCGNELEFAARRSDKFLYGNVQGVGSLTQNRKRRIGGARFEAGPRWAGYAGQFRDLMLRQTACFTKAANVLGEVSIDVGHVGKIAIGYQNSNSVVKATNR